MANLEYGFFNSKFVNGQYDRKYNSDQMSEMFEGLISDGVYESVENGLQVRSKSGMTVQVMPGRAMLDSRWLRLRSAFDITLKSSHVTLNRYTAIMMRVNYNDRTCSIITVDSPDATTPTVPAVTRTSMIKDYMLAYVYVRAGSMSISQSNITDTRLDNERCGMVTGLVDQVNTKDLFIQYQTAFEEDREERQTAFDEWFNDVKDTLSSVTLMRSYNNTYFSVSEDQTAIPIGISQFKSSLDILQVYVNGIKLDPGTDYIVDSDTQITLTKGVEVGTPVSFTVFKSVDGSQAETVVSQVYDLQQWTYRQDKYQYHTTGKDDNKKLSEMIQSFLTGHYSPAQIKIEVIGDNFNIGGVVSGDGTSSNRYKYFVVGESDPATGSDKMVILDFGKCGTISASGLYGNSIIFFGKSVRVENLNMVISGGTSLTFTQNQDVIYKNCNIKLSGRGTVIFAQKYGRFEGCNITVDSADGSAYCFAGAEGGVIVADRCKCLAYTGVQNTGAVSAAFYIPSGLINAILMATNCICPEVYIYTKYQTNSIKINSGKYTLVGNVLFEAISTYSQSAGTEHGTIVADVTI